MNYFIGATIATTKQNKEDWSVPGRIYVGKLPETPDEELKVEILRDGMYRNHGYYRDYDGSGNVCGYFGCDDGLYKVIPPENENLDWKIEKILDGYIGEVSIIDIDNDDVNQKLADLQAEREALLNEKADNTTGIDLSMLSTKFDK